MSSNVTKIHFTDFCKSVIDDYSDFIEDEGDRLGVIKQLVSVCTYIWNVASSSKSFEDVEKKFQSLESVCDDYVQIEFIQCLIKYKWKNYRYDKKIILHTNVVEEEGRLKIYSYLLDEKEYDCPEAQVTYDEINSAYFQAELAKLPLCEQNIKIADFIFFKSANNKFPPHNTL